MAKGYWIAFYRSVSHPAALAEYAKLAGPALAEAGGTALARGAPAKVFEDGINQRTVIIEFESVEKAIAAYETDGYRAARAVLGRAAERDLRIVEGVG
ncbi:DUF1330 domain-containing protein [Mesorhizobium sp. M7A.F.Ca.US.006.01.1.1]|uniref:DUF1330 domain-containing protein n=1 Tax=Mesorhizobium sp. M7A.F.Ca.US.006.01.1.1 TaxID=2496707 RepID=UPI000FCBE4A1|nr:DUF1330 domain-containing protein [Mesorhizobium sp. M7A.F.Ca.US.006.01.1.1]RUZ71289.1 DUF1330 domain-containing protein [Mesorhizobium sp. M7A.F.Ca.US.006.01.1.1]